jgi:hypothetical protein
MKGTLLTYLTPDPTATAAKSFILVRTTLIPLSSLALSSKTLDLYNSGLPACTRNLAPKLQIYALHAPDF